MPKMYSSEDLEKFDFDYQTEWMLQGISIQTYCLRNIFSIYIFDINYNPSNWLRGYIGSHTLLELYNAGHSAVVVDNLSNSNPFSLGRVAKIIGVEAIPFYEVDIRDCAGIEKVFAEHKFDACIHFAGLKVVGESVEKPLEYYDNNIAGTLVLVEVMRNHDYKNIIFSSRATVYGDPV